MSFVSYKKHIIRLISIAVIVTFSFFEVAYAAPVFDATTTSVTEISRLQIDPFINQPSKIDIPFGYANLKEIHEGEGDRLIIHIQDAHTNLSGQTNLAKTLDHFMKKYDLSLVLAEGSSRDSSLNEIRKMAPMQDWKVVARRFLFDGVISGEEYLNLTSEHAMKIMGVEYRDLYDESIRAYAALVDRRKDILQYLHKAQKSLDRLKQKFYPQTILDYESKKNKNEEDEFVSNFEDLVDLTRYSSISFEDYSEIQKLILLKSSEKEINFKKANQEQAQVFKKISERGGDQIVKQIVSESKKLKNSQIAQFSLMQKILKTAEEKQVAVNVFPELQKYKKYLKNFSDLNFEMLLNQIEKLEDDVYKNLLTDDDARKVRAIDRFIGLLGNAHKLQMSSRDFNLYELNEPDFPTESWLAFMNRQLADANFFEDMIPYKSELDEAKDHVRKFYSLVSDRDHAFIENANKIMDKEREKAAVLIAGGYHTEHLTELLKKNKTSYLVLTPIVTDKTDHKKYEKLLLANLRAHEKDLREKSTNPYSAQNVAPTKIPRGLRDMDFVSFPQVLDRYKDDPTLDRRGLAAARLSSALKNLAKNRPENFRGERDRGIAQDQAGARLALTETERARLDTATDDKVKRELRSLSRKRREGLNTVRDHFDGDAGVIDQLWQASSPGEVKEVLVLRAARSLGELGQIERVDSVLRTSPTYYSLRLGKTVSLKTSSVTTLIEDIRLYREKGVGAKVTKEDIEEAQDFIGEAQTLIDSYLEMLEQPEGNVLSTEEAIDYLIEAREHLAVAFEFEPQRARALIDVVDTELLAIPRRLHQEALDAATDGNTIADLAAYRAQQAYVNVREAFSSRIDFVDEQDFNQLEAYINQIDKSISRIQEALKQNIVGQFDDGQRSLGEDKLYVEAAQIIGGIITSEHQAFSKSVGSVGDDKTLRGVLESEAFDEAKTSIKEAEKFRRTRSRGKGGEGIHGEKNFENPRRLAYLVAYLGMTNPTVASTLRRLGVVLPKHYSDEGVGSTTVDEYNSDLATLDPTGKKLEQNKPYTPRQIYQYKNRHITRKLSTEEERAFTRLVGDHHDGARKQLKRERSAGARLSIPPDYGGEFSPQKEVGGSIDVDGRDYYINDSDTFNPETTGFRVAGRYFKVEKLFSESSGAQGGAQIAAVKYALMVYDPAISQWSMLDEVDLEPSVLSTFDVTVNFRRGRVNTDLSTVETGIARSVYRDNERDVDVIDLDGGEIVKDRYRIIISLTKNGFKPTEILLPYRLTTSQFSRARRADRDLDFARRLGERHEQRNVRGLALRVSDAVPVDDRDGVGRVIERDGARYQLFEDYSHEAALGITNQGNGLFELRNYGAKHPITFFRIDPEVGQPASSGEDDVNLGDRTEVRRIDGDQSVSFFLPQDEVIDMKSLREEGQEMPVRQGRKNTFEPEDGVAFQVVAKNAGRVYDDNTFMVRDGVLYYLRDGWKASDVNYYFGKNAPAPGQSQIDAANQSMISTYFLKLEDNGDLYIENISSEEIIVKPIAARLASSDTGAFKLLDKPLPRQVRPLSSTDARVRRIFREAGKVPDFVGETLPVQVDNATYTKGVVERASGRTDVFADSTTVVSFEDVASQQTDVNQRSAVLALADSFGSMNRRAKSQGETLYAVPVTDVGKYMVNEKVFTQFSEGLIAMIRAINQFSNIRVVPRFVYEIDGEYVDLFDLNNDALNEVPLVGLARQELSQVLATQLEGSATHALEQGESRKIQEHSISEVDEVSSGAVFTPEPIITEDQVTIAPISYYAQQTLLSILDFSYTPAVESAVKSFRKLAKDRSIRTSDLKALALDNGENITLEIARKSEFKPITKLLNGLASFFKGLASVLSSA